MTLSLLFLMGALIATVYFFNHIAHLLQAIYASKSVADGLMHELGGSFVEDPAELDQGRKKELDELRGTVAGGGVVIGSTGHGYV